MKYIVYLFSLTLLLQSCSSSNDESKLPILGERAPVEKIVDGKTVIDTLYHTIPPFSYFNQDSVMISNTDFDGKIYVADFFFTACTSICPVMHRNMMDIYEKYKDNEHVMLLSHSIDVKYDFPSRLKKYADKLGVSSDKWHFVHGSKDSIFNVSASNYLVEAFEDKTDPQGLVHQGWFILVDTKKQIRAAYDGTKADQVKLLMLDMDKLLKEENLNAN